MMESIDLERANDVDRLRVISLFKKISEEKLASIWNKMRFSSFEQDEIVVSQGDHVNSVFFVISGKVQANYTSYTGKTVYLREFGPGRMFGELAAFDRYRAIATFVALEKTLIGTISSPQYRKICVQDPLIAEAAFYELSGRTRSLIFHMVEMSTLGANNRIHAELLRLGRQGSISGSRSEISPAPTHADIAFRVNTQREVVTRELNRLESLGIVQKTRSSIVITCMTRLEGLVENVVGPLA